MNYKNLNYEIETTTIRTVLNYKNLNYEIETDDDPCSSMPDQRTMNYKNLNYEIETSLNQKADREHEVRRRL